MYSCYNFQDGQTCGTAENEMKISCQLVNLITEQGLCLRDMTEITLMIGFHFYFVDFQFLKSLPEIHMVV